MNTALLAGGGLKTGQVIGATDKWGERIANRPVHLQEVLATIYRHFGIDAATAVLDDVISTRPRPLLGNYGPIRELV